MAEEFSLKAVLGVDDQAAGPVGRIKGHFEQLKTSIGKSEAKLKSFNRHMADLKSGAKFLAVGLAAGGLAKSLIQSTLETGKLKAEIKGLGVSGTGIKSITASANEAAAEFGTSREAFLSATYDIKSGISSLGEKDLGRFTAIVAKTAAAGKADIAQMGSAFASVFNTFRDQYKKESDFDFGKRIANNMAFAINKFQTDGSKLQTSMETIGASAAALGVTFEEQTVVLGSLMNASEGGVAGTALRSFLNKAAGAASKMGLEFTDAKGHLLPVADILDKIKGKFPDLKSAAAQSEIGKAFGSDEALKVVSLLGGKTSDLRTKLSELRDSQKPGGKSFLDDMARVNTDNTLSNMEKLSEVWKGLKEIIGEKISAPFGAIVTGLKNMLYWLVQVFTKYPALGSLTGYLIAGVAVFATLIGAIKTARATMGLYRLMSITTTVANKGLFASLWANKAAYWANIKAMAITVAGDIRMAAVKVATLIPAIWAGVTATWAFNTALLLNPITWVVIGIAALVAGIIGLIVYWDEVKVNFLSDWESFKQSFSGLLSWFGNLGAKLGQTFSSAWESVKKSFSGLLSWFGNLGAKLWQTFVSGLKKGFGIVKNTVGSLLSGVRKLIPFSDAKEGPLSDLTKSGMSFTKTFSTGITQASPDLKQSTEKLLGNIDLTPRLPNSNTNSGSGGSIMQNFQQAASGGARITTGSLINLNINGSDTKISVSALGRTLAELITQEINKQEAY